MAKIIKTTNHADGSQTVTIQMAPRAKQVDGIADSFTEALTGEKGKDVVVDAKTAHQLLGYAEQLRIIAHEMRKKGYGT